MEDKLLTVKEYADIRKCSVGAVYKRLNSRYNTINNYVVIKNNKKYLKSSILTDEGLSNDGVIPYNTGIEETGIKGYNTGITPPEENKEIRELKEQLKNRDDEIAELRKQVELLNQRERDNSDRLADLLEQSQQLLLRTNQLLLAQKQKPELIEPEPEETTAPQTEKKSWWQKLWS